MSAVRHHLLLRGVPRDVPHVQHAILHPLIPFKELEFRDGIYTV
jgi:hypothetical protein